ncbi:RtcB family protein [Methanotorris formicicus]|uniref:tRNA-splicing ligase RtcB n=1 Tax=Methanotorris formicicus Mc-S-70 TaxID=647171 RepID=H1KX77_9EURY|nr:RtcB family protein [Methanotorris formicicus]EHP88508.1 protein of unknown function UPF0027 [Methanotorris formicicus Mc-S-70]
MKEYLKKVSDAVYELPKDYKECMRVPGRIFLSEILLEGLEDDVLEQIANVACLPGIQKYSLAMPDCHYGYGFCLHPDAKVLTENGFYYRIKDYENLKDERVEVFNTEDKKIEPSEVKKFFKLKPYCKIYKVRTKLGYETIATEDHPFYTPNGMVKLKKLRVGDRVAIYPFEGVVYEEPLDDVIINEKDIIKCMERLNLSKKRMEIILRKLKDRGLIPLTYNHKKLPYLLKIIGFVFGDASMNFIGKKKDGIIHFSSKHLDDLEKIREDIKKIGYTPSRVYNDKKGCYRFYVNASSLVVLLCALGVPIGNKTLKKYNFPEWIFNCKLWQKRLFLASFFGSELRKPYPRKDRKALFTFPTLEMAKDIKIKEDALKFLENIAKLLNEFGVEATITKRNSTHKRNDGIETVRYVLTIIGTSKNLINLWTKIGYEYNKERQELGCYAVAFLKYRERGINRRKILAEKIKELFEEGKKPSEIIRLLNVNKGDERFVKDIWNKLKNGKEIDEIRVPSNFPSYEEFIKERKVGDGLIWDEIECIEEVDVDEVYDFTINHKDHNFIADNFLVSNCIGGVAAFDVKGGVISPGGVGFDINCLTPDANILTEDGYFIKLEKLKEKLDLYVKIYNTEEGEKSSNILFVSERDAKEKIIRIKTESGRILEGSKDHPVLTLNGYVPMSMLKEGDDVIVYPYEGVEYEEPSDEIILDEDDFAEYDKQIIKYLKDRGLLPFKMNNKNIGIIARLLGFAYGDGSIVKGNGDRERLYVAFYGKKEVLTKIKEDLEKLGIKASKIYSRKREVEIRNAYGDEYTSLCEDNPIKITSKAFALFMHKLGMPIGKKTEQIYKIPEWIKKAPKWVKRNFLAGLFGADRSRVVFKNYTPLPINLTMSKSVELKENILEFLNEIKLLLKEFEIESMIYEIKSLEGKVSYRLAIVREESIKNFLGKINYEYSKEKKVIGLLAYEYLKRKDAIKEIRKKCIEKAKELYEKGLSISEILKMDEFRNEFINRRLIERTIYGKLDGDDVRVSTKFPKFEEFIKKYGVRGGFVIDKIKEIKEIPYDSKLCDVGIVSKEHNFIANSIVVHNCGVRLIRTNLTKEEVKPKIKELVSEIFKNVPSGLGSKGKIRITKNEIDDVLEEGAKWAINEGYGWEEDIKFIEEHGYMKDADASLVSDSAKKRGLPQLGSLGSGNHFLEIQYVDKVFDEETGEIFGVEENQVVVMVHCLPESSKILTEYGYCIKIKDLENCYDKIKVITYDKENKTPIPAKIKKFWKFKNNKNIYKIKTFTGKEIVCTEDHPIWTPSGWKQAKDLKPDDLVLIYPFEGVEYEDPEDKVIVSEEDIINAGGTERIVKNLKKKGLLPLKLNHKDIGIIARLVGYAFGDAWVGGKRPTVKFIDDLEVLKRIKSDLDELGFSSTIVKVMRHKSEINHIMSNKEIKRHEFEGEGYQLVVSTPSFAILLKSLGVPYGKKTDVPFNVPKWIKESPKWIKRLFLAGYFGAEMNIIKQRKNEAYRLENLKIPLNKVEDLLNNGISFMEEIKEILEEFGVKGKIIVKPYVKRKDGKTSYKIILTLSSNLENIIKFASKIGYEYNKKRQSMLIKSLQYYLYKKKIVELESIKTGKDVEKLLTTAHKYRKIKTETYDSYISRYSEGDLTIWDAVVSVEKLKEDVEIVYDLTIDDKNHNFIADNFVVSNTGSRGLGHQICADYIRVMEKAAKKYGIKLPDRQLACAPIESEEGIEYYKAMSCGANYAWTNRQMITHWVRESFEKVFKTSAEDLEMNIIYDVAHNIAKMEEHVIDGKKKKVVVHRKGATRAFGPGSELIPKEYRRVGQPVIIPGDMGTASYLMHGTEKAMEETFGSTAHGAGRTLSRAKALKLWKGKEIKEKLEKEGIIVMADSRAVIAEECPEAYKSIDLVADVCHKSGISLKVSRMKPMGVVKG